MNILIPIDSKEKSTANIANLSNVKAWAFISLSNGNIEYIDIFKTKNDIEKLIDFVIIKNKDENIEEFLEEGIEVLVASFQKTIEEIVEAYMFRELYEI